MSWEASDPKGVPTGKTIILPTVFCLQADRWAPILGTNIDEMSSDARTMDLLSQLLLHTEPAIIVEVGTYRGWGTVCLAETLRLFNLSGHVWTCDPVDHAVGDLLKQADLQDRVSLTIGTFEQLLPSLPGPIEFCFIDASSADEASLRVRYTHLALANAAPGAIIVVDDAAGVWEGAPLLRKLSSVYLHSRRGVALIQAPF